MPNFQINTILGACLCFIIIFIDYIRKFNTDYFQRRLFLFILTSSFVSSLAFLANILIEQMPGQIIHGMLYFFITVFLISQNIAYYTLAIFLDYFIRQNTSRAIKGIKIVCVILLLSIIITILNLRFHFFFYITPQNIYKTGALYTLRLFLSYFPLIIIVANILLSHKFIKQTQVVMLAFFGVFGVSGSIIDLILKEGSLIWACMASGYLYIYFFIVQNDSKLDALTGIGNRLAFNELIVKLSHQNTPQSYAIVMIDIDRFKAINDTLGHIEGDHALQDFAKIVKDSIRHSDFAARYGGDEFIIVIKAENNIEILMQRIEDAISALNNSKKRKYKLNISYGYDVYATRSGQNINSFITHIDRLMYQNKASKQY